MFFTAVIIGPAAAVPTPALLLIYHITYHMLLVEEQKIYSSGCCDVISNYDDVEH